MVIFCGNVTKQNTYKTIVWLLLTFSFRLHFTIVRVLVLRLHHDLGLVDQQLGRGLVLTHAGTTDVSGVLDPGSQDDQSVDALVQLLDLDPVVLLHDVPGNLPLGVRLIVTHLTLEGDLLLLSAGLVLQRLQELVDGRHPELHLGLVTVGLALEQALRLAGNVLDDQHSLPALVDHLDLVEPVGVALDDLDALEVPGDVRLLDVDLAVDLDGPVLDLAETLELPGEVAGLGCSREILLENEYFEY